MIKLSDIKGLSQLATDSVSGITNLVKNMHENIDRNSGLFGVSTTVPIGAITDIVFQNIHSVNNIVRNSMETILTQIEPMFEENESFPERDVVLAALNGVVGDYLAEQNNPLAIPMRLKYKGVPLNINDENINNQIPDFNGKLIVLVHGLCMNDQQWLYKNHNHGEKLAEDIGYTPVYLNYNTGLHISFNGQGFSDILEQLVSKISVDGFIILAHSMGGLVTRSACYYGEIKNYKWPRLLKKQIFLGTPHHGAPLEKGGNWVNILLDYFPHSAPFSKLPKIRSAGITDLRYGYLRDEDWSSCDRFDNVVENKSPIPLPENVQSYAIAATLGTEQSNVKNSVVGDGLVPVNSALGKHSLDKYCLSFPESSQFIAYGLNHWDLICSESVYNKIKQWCV